MPYLPDDIVLDEAPVVPTTADGRMIVDVYGNLPSTKPPLVPVAEVEQQPTTGTFLPDDIELDKDPVPLIGENGEYTSLLAGLPTEQPTEASGLAGEAWRDTVGSRLGIDSENQDAVRQWSGPGGMLYPVAEAAAVTSQLLGGGLNASIAGGTQFLGNLFGADPGSTRNAARSLVELSNIGQLYAGGNALARNVPVAATAPKASRNALAPAGDDVASSAARLGITPSPATVGGRTAEGLQIALGNAPGSAGPVRAAVDREIEALTNAARATAAKMGTVSTPQAAGETMAKGARAWERATGRAARKLFEKRDELLGGKEAPVVMGNTGKAIAQFYAESPSSPVLAQLLEHPKVRRLREGLTDNEELTVGDVAGPNGLLSHVRTVARNAHKSSTVTGATEFQLNQLKKAILSDLNVAADASDAIKGRSGPGSARVAQRDADAAWRARARSSDREMKLPLASVEDPINVSGERVYRQMFSDMKEEGGNIKRLRQTLERMPANQRRTFSATAFDDLGKAKASSQNAEGDAWSFETFGTNWGAMSKEARATVFGGKGVDREVADIVKYVERLKTLNKARNFSNTSQNVLRGGSAIAAMTALVTTGPGAAVGVGAVHGGLNVVGRAFVSNPALRVWTKNAFRATAAGKETQVRTLLRRLPAMVAKDPTIRDDVLKFQTALNSALASRGTAAANDVGGLGGLNAPVGVSVAASPGNTEEDQ